MSQPHLSHTPPAGRSITRRAFLATLAAGSAVLTSGMPLLAAASDPLQREIEDLVDGMFARGVLQRGEKTSWLVYDFTSGKRLVSINAEAPRQAASMIKPFVAQAYFYQVHEGKLPYTGKARQTMVDMIRHSSNAATNRLISLVSGQEGKRGASDVERVLKKHAPKIFLNTRIVESIPPGGRTYRNLASAGDYSRFLYALWLDRLPYADELREIMALPNRDRISHGVEAIPDDVTVYDKTGSTAQLCGDMGIVEARGRGGERYPYNFVGIIERSSSAKDYVSWIRRRSNAIRAVSETVYRHMREIYPLA